MGGGWEICTVSDCLRAHLLLAMDAVDSLGQKGLGGGKVEDRGSTSCGCVVMKLS